MPVIRDESGKHYAALSNSGTFLIDLDHISGLAGLTTKQVTSLITTFTDDELMDLIEDAIKEQMKISYFSHPSVAGTWRLEDENNFRWSRVIPNNEARIPIIELVGLRFDFERNAYEAFHAAYDMTNWLDTGCIAEIQRLKGCCIEDFLADVATHAHAAHALFGREGYPYRELGIKVFDLELMFFYNRKPVATFASARDACAYLDKRYLGGKHETSYLDDIGQLAVYGDFVLPNNQHHNGRSL